MKSISFLLKTGAATPSSRSGIETRRGRRVPILILFLAVFCGHSLAADAPDPATRNARTKWVNEPKPGTLPTGVTHRTFFSKALHGDVGYCIYLPPGYEAETSRRYPVIYNLHGAGGNE